MLHILRLFQSWRHFRFFYFTMSVEFSCKLWFREGCYMYKRFKKCRLHISKISAGKWMLVFRIICHLHFKINKNVFVSHNEPFNLILLFYVMHKRTAKVFVNFQIWAKSFFSFSTFYPNIIDEQDKIKIWYTCVFMCTKLIFFLFIKHANACKRSQGIYHLRRVLSCRGV